MGGHAAGEVASQEAVETIYGMVKQGLRAFPQIMGKLTDEHARAACRLLEGAVQAATYMIFAMGSSIGQERAWGPPSARFSRWANTRSPRRSATAASTRCAAAASTQITEDHTLISWQLKQGLITQEEARRSPHRNVITRAVGNHDYVEVDTGLFALEPGDKYLLCSDGLHGYLRTTRLRPFALLEPKKRSSRFIELANQRGGKDNITAILVEVK